MTAKKSKTTAPTLPKPEVPRFLDLLYRMVDGNNDSINWSEEGDMFTITNRDSFVNDCLPEYGVNPRYDSFNRQLLVYGF